MWEIEKNFIVKLGGITFIDVNTLVDYKGTSLFTLKRDDESGYLGIYFDIYDSFGKLIAKVKRNEIYLGNKQNYEIIGSNNRYTLFERVTGKVLCDIKKREEAHPAELDISVKLYTPSGFLFEATPERTNVGGASFTGAIMQSCGIGISVN